MVSKETITSYFNSFEGITVKYVYPDGEISISRVNPDYEEGSKEFSKRYKYDSITVKQNRFGWKSSNCGEEFRKNAIEPLNKAVQEAAEKAVKSITSSTAKTIKNASCDYDWVGHTLSH